MTINSLFGILIVGATVGSLMCGFLSSFEEYRIFRYITKIVGVCIALFLIFMLGCICAAILNGGTL